MFREDLAYDLRRRNEKRIYWMKVKVTGRFDHENELFLAARSLRGNVGFHVITPFKVSDTNSFILINRGWVSKEKKDAKKRV